MFIKYVASNVKGGVSCVLGPKTLIIGPNGTGKSAVVNSIELALSGKASDLAGRAEVAADAALIALAPDRKGELFSRAVLSNGEEAVWKIGGKDKKKHLFPEKLINPEQVIALRPVRGAVIGNQETARKFFLGFSLPNLTADDVMQRIPTSLHSAYLNATLKAELNWSPVDRLLLALEHATKEAKRGRSKAKDQKEIATVVADGLEPLPTDEVVAALKSRYSNAKKALAALDQRIGAAKHAEKLISDSAPLKNEIDEAAQNIAKIDAMIAQADAMLAQTPTPGGQNPDAQRVIALVEALAKVEAEQGGSVACPICKCTPAPGSFQQRHQTFQQFLQAEAAKVGPYNFAMEQRGQLLNSRGQWAAHQQAKMVQYQSTQAVLAQGNVQAPSEAEYKAAHDEVAAVDKELSRIDALKAQWSQTRKANDTANDANKDATQWDGLEESCKKAVAELMDSGVQRFMSRVQEHLPPFDKFVLALRDERKQVFNLGFARNGTLHTALSGAEWARMMIALAAVCVDPDKLSVLIPEERAFDAKTLELVLHAFGAITSQVVITSPVAPTAIPPGWLVVDTTKNDHRSGQLT